MPSFKFPSTNSLATSVHVPERLQLPLGKDSHAKSPPDQRDLDPHGKVSRIGEHLEAYVDRQASRYVAEDIVHFHISTHFQWFDLHIIRGPLLKNGNSAQDAVASMKCRGTDFRNSLFRNASVVSNGCAWPKHDACSWKIPSNALPGIYIGYLVPYGKFSTQVDPLHAVFVVGVLSDTVQQPLLRVQIDTFTWAAYNKYGGRNLYTRPFTPIVSLNRPYSFATEHVLDLRGRLHHYFDCGMAFLSWLQREGFNKYDVVTDADIDSGREDGKHIGLWVLPCHPEYWSKQMLQSLNDAIDRGVHVMYLGGNGLYWKIGTERDKIECRKGNAKHSLSAFLGEKGGKWSDQADQQLTSMSVLGVRYVESSLRERCTAFRLTSCASLWPPWIQMSLPQYIGLKGFHRHTDRQIGRSAQRKGSGAACWEIDSVDVDHDRDSVVTIVLGTAGSQQQYLPIIARRRSQGTGVVFTGASVAFVSGLLPMDDHLSNLTAATVDFLLQNNAQSLAWNDFFFQRIRCF